MYFVEACMYPIMRCTFLKGFSSRHMQADRKHVECKDRCGNFACAMNWNTIDLSGELLLATFGALVSVLYSET